MKTYKIAAIIRESERVKAGYLEMCKALADPWDEAAGTATFDDISIAEIKKAFIAPANGSKTTCSKCRGL
jgi:hypothetical protein